MPRPDQPHPQFDPNVALDELQMLDLVERRNDFLGQTESEREIFKILRRRHHDGVRRAVIHEGNRRLLRDRAIPLRENCRRATPYGPRE